MTLTDLISKRSLSHSAELFRHSSSNDDLNRKDHHKQKVKRLHGSVLDLLHWHRPAESTESAKANQQQRQTSIPHRPSIIKSSDLARTISKKSVTFASAFDLIENEDEKNSMDFHHETTHNNDEMTSEEEEEEDLITVIPNKRIDDERITDPYENTEPYPFRSEIPSSLSSYSNSSTDEADSSHHSRKKIIRHFIQHRHPKKLRHPIKTISPINAINRSTPEPDMAFSTRPSTTALDPTNNQHRQARTIRTWFKSSSLGRFIQSLARHSHETGSNTSKSQSKVSQEYSDVIY